MRGRLSGPPAHGFGNGSCLDDVGGWRRIPDISPIPERDRMVSTQPPAVDSQEIRINRLDLLETLADDLAHEIKNPLHSMVINLEVLRRRAARHEPEAGDLARYIGVLAMELERVNQRVELLLRFVRPSGPGDKATLNEIVEELQELVTLEGNHREVAVDFRLASVPTGLYLSRPAVRQALVNLVFEALSMSASSGPMVIRTERLGDAAVVTVQRAGPQEPATVENGISRLDVVRAIVETIGGSVDVEMPADGNDGWTVSLIFPPGSG
jgi:signal transduction histidine kinase